MKVVIDNFSVGLIDGGAGCTTFTSVFSPSPNLLLPSEAPIVASTLAQRMYSTSFCGVSVFKT